MSTVLEAGPPQPPRQPEQPGSTPRREPPRRSAFILALLVVLTWLVVGGAAGALGSRLTEVQENDNAAFLPESAESTRALELQQRFVEQDTFPAVIVYERASGITPADRERAAADLAEIAQLDAVVGEPSPPIPSEDGQALQVVVPLDASDGLAIGADVERVRAAVEGGGGLDTYVTGIAGIQADFAEVFETIDSTLLLATAAVVIVILLLVYRSPLLWVAPILAAGLSLSVAQAVVYLLARNDVLDVNGQSAGILTVLVFGAGTDYALLLISRYREELHLHERPLAAMRVALRGAAPAILASGATVVLGLLCLLVSDLSSNRGLGPVAAIGIISALAVMLTFLPAVLLVFGRSLFLPFVPRYDGTSHAERGLWGRVARGIGRRPRAAWVASGLVLVALCAGVTQLRADGIAQTDAFTTETEAVTGQQVLARHFPAGSGSPAEVLGRAAAADELLAAVRGVDGVAQAAFLTELPPGGPPGAGADPGVDPTTLPPRVEGGLVQVNAVLADPADSSAAARTVQRLRDSVSAVPGADAVVGGLTAVDLDVQAASQRDRAVIIPIVLVVIFVVLALLLRALIAPLLLIATVVLSFFATLGACALVFNYVFDFPGADSSFPLFSFVFLVALGIDYNIFLMTRVREESLKSGTRRGTLVGLAVTGGVITSAGVVLAATFSVLGVLPLVFLAQLGFAVAFGVLLDTLLVRSVLVPALTYDLGRRVWWPSRLARARE